MNEPKPRFTGLFIPAEIWEIEGLTLMEINLLAWIDALYCKEHGGCFASNEYLAKQMKGIKENTIAKSITKLRGMGLIEDVSFNGRQRVIRATIGRSIDQHQSKSALDLNPTQGWIKIQPSIGKKSNPKDPVLIYYNKEDRKEYMSDMPPPNPTSASPSLDSATPCGLTIFFFDKLKEINPKIKPPNWKKWDDCMRRILVTDKRPEDEVKQVIEYIAIQHNESDRDFTWSQAVQSPEKLRKHYAAIWLEMNKKRKETKQQIVHFNENHAESIGKIFAARNDIVIGYNYIEFTNGTHCEHIKFEDIDFKKKVNKQLKHRKLNYEVL